MTGAPGPEAGPGTGAARAVVAVAPWLRSELFAPDAWARLAGLRHADPAGPQRGRDERLHRGARVRDEP